MRTITVDVKRLIDTMKACDHIRYRLGAKPALQKQPSQLSISDCSGYTRYLLATATHGKIVLPHGSVNQRKWCEAQGFKRTAYLNCQWEDGRLRIAFMDAVNGHGHVWFCLDGQTIECWSGRGVGRRPWNTPILKRHVDHCFVLTDQIIAWED